LPEVQEIRSIVCESTEKQRAMAHGPIVRIHHIGGMWPTRFVPNVGRHELERLSHAAAVGKFELPQTVLRRRKDLADRRHGIEIEKRITIWLGAPEFLRKTTVRRDLAGNQHALESITRELHEHGVSCQA